MLILDCSVWREHSRGPGGKDIRNVGFVENGGPSGWDGGPKSVSSRDDEQIGEVTDNESR